MAELSHGEKAEQLLEQVRGNGLAGSPVEIALIRCMGALVHAVLALAERTTP